MPQKQKCEWKTVSNWSSSVGIVSTSSELTVYYREKVPANVTYHPWKRCAKCLIWKEWSVNLLSSIDKGGVEQVCTSKQVNFEHYFFVHIYIINMPNIDLAVLGCNFIWEIGCVRWYQKKKTKNRHSILNFYSNIFEEMTWAKLKLLTANYFEKFKKKRWWLLCNFFLLLQNPSACVINH